MMFVLVCEGVDGSDNVSGNDKEVSEESCTGSFTRLSSPWETALVIQCGSRKDEVWRLKGFSRF